MGSRVTASVSITPRVSSERLYLDCFANWYFFRVRIPGIEYDGCHAKQEDCPWPANVTRDLVLPLTIPHLWFSISPTVTFRITNEKKQVIACFQGRGLIYS
ncbi:hypothetical protein RF11_12708 [Thelohanellus kitauei]|uniref:MD-2-related lipid-recognition domain-containing protein n=1 Tax=Thelohanellus kitauei TaxID=669202 RepID=A0A0C2IMQ2_THEKT|nr:hypothetical protein RF11_12708 [Thelohanellus kitauei]